LRSNLFGPSRTLANVGIEVRGAPALRKYLDRVAPGVPRNIAVREHLRPWQQAQIAYELGCETCGALPEGRVRTPDGDRIEFRCPSGFCEHSRSRARIINVDINVLERFRARYGWDISPIIQRALYRFSVPMASGRSLGERWTQMPVRLSPTQYYLYNFESLLGLSELVHACLLAWEEDNHA
jgi:hypothetical protein